MRASGDILIGGVRAGTLTAIDFIPAGGALGAAITGSIARLWCSAGAKRATIRPAPGRGAQPTISPFEGDIVAITPTSLQLANVKMKRADPS